MREVVWGRFCGLEDSGILRRMGKVRVTLAGPGTSGPPKAEEDLI